MLTDLIVLDRPTNSEIGPLSDIANRASEFIEQSKSKNTIRAYRADWLHFESWCNAHGQFSLPASSDAVALYAADLSATHKPATLTRRLSAISQAHQIAGLESPTTSAKVRLVMAGIRRTKGTAQLAKTPVLVDDLKRMVSRLPAGLLGVRDRALLLIGFCGAFRRSELVALDFADAAVTREGLVVTIRRSKTDQEGEGRKIGIPYAAHLETCALRSLQEWLEKGGITEGPLFRPINRHGKMAGIRSIRKQSPAWLGFVKGWTHSWTFWLLLRMRWRQNGICGTMRWLWKVTTADAGSSRRFSRTVSGRPQEDVPSSHLERMDARFVCSVGLARFFRRETGSIKQSVPVPQEIRFLADHRVRTDLANVLH